MSIADEVPFDIPESWEWCRLSDLTVKEIKRGKSPTYIASSGTLVFAQKCNAKAGGIDMSLAKFLDEKTLGKYPAEEFMQDYDIVVNSTGTGTMGRIGLFRDSDNPTGLPIVPDSHVTVVRLNHSVSIDYLLCCLQYYQPYLEEHGEGSTNQKELKPDTIKNLYIPLPPISEQKRIADMVTILEPYISAYGKKDSQLAELNKEFPEQLKKSILQLAVQGKLVPQDPADEPASILLERIRAEKERLIKEGKIKRDKNESVIFRRDNSHYEKRGKAEVCIDEVIPFEIPETWAWVRWGALSESIQYGYNAPAQDHGRIKMVRISDIQDGKVLWNSVPYCNIPEADIESYLLRKNDILFARTGGTVGKSYLVQDVPEDSIYAGYLIRTRYSELLCSQYLKYFMDSPLYWSQLKEGTTATAQPNCNGKTLGNMLIPIPPVAEQLRIVELLQTAFSEASAL